MPARIFVKYPSNFRIHWAVYFVSTGIWGSAFTILLQRVLHEGKPPDDTIKNMRNTGDLRGELRKWHKWIGIHIQKALGLHVLGLAFDVTQTAGLSIILDLQARKSVAC